MICDCAYVIHSMHNKTVTGMQPAVPGDFQKGRVPSGKEVPAGSAV